MRKFLFRLLNKFTQTHALSTCHAAGVSRLHSKCFPAGWSEDDIELLLNDPKVFGAGVFVFGVLLGFVLSRVAADEAEILTIATHPFMRRLGIGKILLTYNVAQVARQHVRSHFLEVAVDNQSALKLYKNLGFHEVGRRKGYYHIYNQPPQDALILKRPIESSLQYVHGYVLTS